MLGSRVSGKRKVSFISLEGIDKTGKTDFCKMLANNLGDRALVTHDPTKKLKPWAKLFINGVKDEVPRTSEAFLLLAARLHSYWDEIKPALEDGKIVIADRFVDSWCAYQAAWAENLTSEEAFTFFLNIQQSCIEKGLLRYPDITVLITENRKVISERIKEEKKPTSYEKNLDKQMEAQKFYLKLLKSFPERLIHIEGKGRTIKKIYPDIVKILKDKGLVI